MSSRIKIILFIVVLLMISAVIAFFHIRSYQRADILFPENSELRLHMEEDGKMILSWPEAESADGYLIKISDMEQGDASGEDSLLWSAECDRNECILEGISSEDADAVRIEAVPLSHYRTLFGERIREGSGALFAAVELNAPIVEGLSYTTDSENQILDIKFHTEERTVYQFCMIQDENIQTEKELTDGNLQIYFGENGNYPVPEEDTPIRFMLRAVRQGEGYIYSGPASETIIVRREDVTEENEPGIPTEFSATGCLIWPVRDLPLYAPDNMEQTGKFAEVCRGYRVLEEQDGNFLIEADGVLGYIDSRYCMINLSEYLGELCAYDIANSYQSLYRMHGHEIPGITGTVITGYEDIRRQDGQFLVPFLYPSCRKLITAAENALADGYRLKIYDAYRPGAATEQLYQITESILDTPLAPLETGTTDEGQERIYRDLVSNDTYYLSDFLARNGSSHNMGIALDLTLETLDGQELQMQTQMHDLSVYSVLERNNGPADLLNRYMTEAGFNILRSEWWHFQDNETRDSLELEYVREGVRAEESSDS